MSPAAFLRSASVMSALLFAGHTLGMPWTPHGSARGAAMSARSPSSARPIVLTALGAFLGMAVLETLYFFAAPIVLTLPIVVLLFGALRKTPA